MDIESLKTSITQYREQVIVLTYLMIYKTVDYVIF